MHRPLALFLSIFLGAAGVVLPASACAGPAQPAHQAQGRKKRARPRAASKTKSRPNPKPADKPKTGDRGFEL
jgi:hypothetical protein